ncbi:MAG: hypothetical protein HY054_02555 [Proteobacteria bacterium]|nr:hypothetical protein [Pseudomonadota bacterium]
MSPSRTSSYGPYLAETGVVGPARRGAVKGAIIGGAIIGLPFGARFTS